MRYAVVIEKTEGNYSAYVPDLPGCIATGDTVESVERDSRRDPISYRRVEAGRIAGAATDE